jgi:hypothetical protein
MHGIRQTVPPAIEPVTLTLAKLHLRLDADFTLDDTLIGLYISAAREHCERYTNTAFYTRRGVSRSTIFRGPGAAAARCPLAAATSPISSARTSRASRSACPSRGRWR